METVSTVLWAGDFDEPIRETVKNGSLKSFRALTPG
jgi:hypothetical protein